MANKIFALEGEWGNKLTHDESIVPILDLMKDVSGIKYVFRKVNTIDSLLKYLNKVSLRSMDDYNFVLLAFHGYNEDQSIELSSGEGISLKVLAKLMKGSFKGKNIHFSSCGIGADINGLKAFKKVTGASTVTGYIADVGFFESSLFDTAIIHHHFTENEQENLKKHMKAIMPKWFKELGYVQV